MDAMVADPETGELQEYGEGSLPGNLMTLVQDAGGHVVNFSHGQTGPWTGPDDWQEDDASYADQGSMADMCEVPAVVGRGRNGEPTVATPPSATPAPEEPPVDTSLGEGDGEGNTEGEGECACRGHDPSKSTVPPEKLDASLGMWGNRNGGRAIDRVVKQGAQMLNQDEVENFWERQLRSAAKACGASDGFADAIGQVGAYGDNLGGMGREFGRRVVQGANAVATPEGRAQIAEGLGNTAADLAALAEALKNDPTGTSAAVVKALGKSLGETLADLGGENGESAQKAAVDRLGADLIGTLLGAGAANSTLRAFEGASKAAKSGKLGAAAKAAVDKIEDATSAGRSVAGKPAAVRGRGVWEKGPAVRGREIEQRLVDPTSKLPDGFKAYDEFKDGVATSIKSVDIESCPSNLRSTVTNAISKMANFDEFRRADVFLANADIKKRVLKIAVPKGSLDNPHMKADIEWAKAYGARQNAWSSIGPVEVQFVEVGP